MYFCLFSLLYISSLLFLSSHLLFTFILLSFLNFYFWSLYFSSHLSFHPFTFPSCLNSSFLCTSSHFTDRHLQTALYLFCHVVWHVTDSFPCCFTAIYVCVCVCHRDCVTLDPFYANSSLSLTLKPRSHIHTCLTLDAKTWTLALEWKMSTDKLEYVTWFHERMMYCVIRNEENEIMTIVWRKAVEFCSSFRAWVITRTPKLRSVCKQIFGLIVLGQNVGVL